MKIKLDENIGRRGYELLRIAGHDVMTVRDKSLQGAHDELIFKVCADEGRVQGGAGGRKKGSPQRRRDTEKKGSFKNRHPGESRDPSINQRVARQMDPGLRPDDDFCFLSC